MAAHVQSDDDDVEISGAFSVSEEGSLNAIRSCEQTKFGCSDSSASIVVGVQANDRVLSIVDVATKPFDSDRRERSGLSTRRLQED